MPASLFLLKSIRNGIFLKKFFSSLPREAVSHERGQEASQREEILLLKEEIFSVTDPSEVKTCFFIKPQLEVFSSIYLFRRVKYYEMEKNFLRNTQKENIKNSYDYY